MSITVVVPVRDGAHLLADCLAAIHEQSQPPDEVLVVVGPSHDGTAETARELAGQGVRVLDNPRGDRASAINVALAVASGDLVALVDAQARLTPDYLRCAAEVLDDRTIAVAGGPMRPVGTTPIGRAMAAALQSPFGVGDSQFHFAGAARDVDSVYLGVYRRDVFDQIGAYNSALARTEDDDVNARIREAGLRIRLDPSIRSSYRCRETLVGIWRQYHGYGYWKVALAAVRPSSIRLRHLVPAVFVLALLSAVVLAATGWWIPIVVLGVAWSAAALVFAVAASGITPDARIRFPVVTLTMHLAYGIGSLQALLQWPRLARQARASAPERGTGEK